MGWPLMAETPLPSRKHFVDLVAGDFRASESSEYRVLKAYASGRLVDGEAIDREAMQNVFIAHAADQLDPHFSMTAIDAALDLAFDAAIGEA